MDDLTGEQHLRRAINGYKESRQAFAHALGFGPDAPDDRLLAEIARLRDTEGRADDYQRGHKEGAASALEKMAGQLMDTATDYFRAGRDEIAKEYRRQSRLAAGEAAYRRELEATDG
jgi:hypothetical protein